MEITTTKTVEQKVFIPIPYFWKDCIVAEKYRAVLDAKTFVDVYHSEGRTCVVNGSATFHMDNIVEAHNRWELATEDEFMEAYNRIVKTLNLQPVLVTNGSTPPKPNINDFSDASDYMVALAAWERNYQPESRHYQPSKQ